MTDYLMTVGQMFGNPAVFVLVMLWTLFWKVFSLWISARRGHRIWFVALLVLNTVGILDIAYIYFFGKEKGQSMKDVMKSLFSSDASESSESSKSSETGKAGGQ